MHNNAEQTPLNILEVHPQPPGNSVHPKISYLSLARKQTSDSTNMSCQSSTHDLFHVNPPMFSNQNIITIPSHGDH